MEMLIAGVFLILAWFIRRHCIFFVDNNTACLLIDWFGHTRPIGQGMKWVWPWESVVEGSATAVVAVPESFTDDFETKDEATIALKFSFVRKTSVAHLKRYIEIDSAKRRDGIIERVRAIANIIIRKHADRDAVMDDYKQIAADIEHEFEQQESEDKTSLEAYYGENIEQLGIAGAELPAILKEAQTKLEAQVKENETKKLEMDNLKKLASALVAESEKRDSKMSFEKAMEIVQLQLGKGNVKKDITIFGIDRGTQDILSAIIKEVIDGRKN